MSIFFESFLRGIPKSRSEIVNDLELPDDITVGPIWINDDDITVRSDSVSESIELELERRSSSDSSLPLSRAMTDSEIDYGRYRRLKNRRLSDPWAEMRAALDAFPPGYLSSLYSFYGEELIDESELTSSSDDDIKPRFDEELSHRMERYLDEECTVFASDDSGLLELQEALDTIRIEDIEFDDFI